MSQSPLRTKARPACQRVRSDARLDYVDQLPCGVPPFQRQPVSLIPGPVPTRADEVGPAEATYYFPIRLPGCNPTGVFFPSGYSFPSAIDVILYFHGFKLGQFKTINQYWKGNIHGIRFREDINRSGKKVVLIAPTLGERPGSRQIRDMGIFAQPTGGDAFLAEVVRWIGKDVWQYATHSRAPVIRNVVLAGHSGAGVILSRQARGMKTSLCEVWGFDSTYGPPSIVKDWQAIARLRPATKFYFYWGTAAPGHNAKKLCDQTIRGVGHRRLPDRGRRTAEKVCVRDNIQVEETVHDHFGALTRNFVTRVQAAQCFQ